MLAMREHGVQDYAVLPDMDATDVGVLAADDRSCLEELGRYLASADAWQRFGIWLLHKHFDPNQDELFVDRTSTAQSVAHRLCGRLPLGGMPQSPHRHALGGGLYVAPAPPRQARS